MLGGAGVEMTAGTADAGEVHSWVFAGAKRGEIVRVPELVGCGVVTVVACCCGAIDTASRLRRLHGAHQVKLRLRCASASGWAQAGAKAVEGEHVRSVPAGPLAKCSYYYSTASTAEMQLLLP